MPFLSAQEFAHRHGGFKALKRFIELANAPDSIHKISKEFDVSYSQAARLRKKLLVCEWLPTDGLKKYLEFEIHVHEHEIEERQEVLKQASRKVLTLVPNEIHR